MSPTPDVLPSLIDRLSAFFFLARRYGEALHAADALSSGERAILKEIAANGTSTVPDLAASRAVSRQAIQKTVDQLIARGALEKAGSEADRRTRQLTVTPAGRALLGRIARRERAEAGNFADAFAADELEAFDVVLTRIEQALRARTKDLYG